MCKQRSQFSRRTLRAASAPPRDPSPSRTSSSSIFCPLLPPPAFLLLPPPFPSVTLLSHLSRHSTADNEPLLTGDYSSFSRDSVRRVLLHEGLRHCERVLEESHVPGSEEERATTDLQEVWSLLKFRELLLNTGLCSK